MDWTAPLSTPAHEGTAVSKKSLPPELLNILPVPIAGEFGRKPYANTFSSPQIDEREDRANCEENPSKRQVPLAEFPFTLLYLLAKFP